MVAVVMVALAFSCGGFGVVAIVYISRIVYVSGRVEWRGARYETIQER